tara:strand:- start:6 stop:626 length:621 start_codon:yes stop_codon:yes gene_type:complete
MAIPVSELQKLTPNSILELFELQLVEGLHYATGNPSNVPTLFRFHSGVNMNNNGNIVWQGNTYQRFPITCEGFEKSGNGKIPRPNLKMANMGGITRSGSVISVTDLLILCNLVTPHNDLLNAKLIRIMITADALDNVNFSSGTNPFGTPSADELPREIYLINRKSTENRTLVEFELKGDLDKTNLRIPKRQVTRKDFPGVGTFINS